MSDVVVRLQEPLPAMLALVLTTVLLKRVLLLFVADCKLHGEEDAFFTLGAIDDLLDTHPGLPGFIKHLAIIDPVAFDLFVVIGDLLFVSEKTLICLLGENVLSRSQCKNASLC